MKKSLDFFQKHIIMFSGTVKKVCFPDFQLLFYKYNMKVGSSQWQKKKKLKKI